jgi:AICAR transformylase/IMP cyclohydrolase PurH
MPKAILSVYDKTGLVEFAHNLADLNWLIASVAPPVSCEIMILKSPR